MAETKNWIEKLSSKLVEGINGVLKAARVDYEFTEFEKNLIANEVLSHAPVIDAEKLALELFHRSYLKWEHDVEGVAEIITDSIDLKIEWKDSMSEWGVFTLIVSHFPDEEDWFFEINRLLKGSRNVVWDEVGFKSQELAQQACEKALRRIVTGQK